ncbi:uncharacterized protein LOC108468792 [Gossypium arboreum]|uniref:Uncharacterized protein n=1 Tax=Gossypium arboreum TaxID=29729 RepID=A0ABR0NXS6_GOSAR|nr:uncharacterized protein LOC108468792 [Gossypium arboreum]KAK5811155.1 hypothetical protein PVK06_026477 [Gossypium arboreum]
MSNLAKLEFLALDITGKNYLSEMLDAEIHLDAKGLNEAIIEGNKASSQDKAKAIISLHHHLHEGLKTEYLNTQYREKGFKKYFEFISCLLVVEQNNELLMKYHESRPIGSTSFLKVSATSYKGKDKGHTSSRGRRHGHGSGLGRGRGRERGGHFRNTHQKWDHNDGKNDNNITGKVESLCYRCGGKNHWSRTYRTPKHLVELYQQSLKDRWKKIETIFFFENDKDDYGIVGTTYLEAADFFTTPEGNN